MQPADLARKSGLTKSTISRVLNGERSPSPDTLDGIARALELPPETVYRKAGLLPEKNYQKAAEEILGYKLAELSERQLDEIIQYIEFIQNRDAAPGGKRTSYKTPTREGSHPPEVLNDGK